MHDIQKEQRTQEQKQETEKLKNTTAQDVEETKGTKEIEERKEKKETKEGTNDRDVTVMEINVSPRLIWTPRTEPIRSYLGKLAGQTNAFITYLRLPTTTEVSVVSDKHIDDIGKTLEQIIKLGRFKENSSVEENDHNDIPLRNRENNIWWQKRGDNAHHLTKRGNTPHWLCLLPKQICNLLTGCTYYFHKSDLHETLTINFIGADLLCGAAAALMHLAISVANITLDRQRKKKVLNKERNIGRYEFPEFLKGSCEALLTAIVASTKLSTHALTHASTPKPQSQSQSQDISEASNLKTIGKILVEKALLEHPQAAILIRKGEFNETPNLEDIELQRFSSVYNQGFNNTTHRKQSSCDLKATLQTFSTTSEDSVVSQISTPLASVSSPSPLAPLASVSSPCPLAPLASVSSPCPLAPLASAASLTSLASLASLET